jgi:hypothetical protein
MINVKETQLVVLLAQNKEERVAEFKKLAEVVPPNSVCNLW